MPPEAKRSLVQITRFPGPLHASRSASPAPHASPWTTSPSPPSADAESFQSSARRLRLRESLYCIGGLAVTDSPLLVFFSSSKGQCKSLDHHATMCLYYIVRKSYIVWREWPMAMGI
ncbi:hypothetical protein BDA96_07G193600 [Sorghum bicolor]|uniref:Uncharacterized protein n=1 Tax=Sorghum bicolor TaxID=4558 RepID=A0A921QNT0_SORBI|nr:hypothetical protein BDA96_07G193600 [Sorghum bicolor]